MAITNIKAEQLLSLLSCHVKQDLGTGQLISQIKHLQFRQVHRVEVDLLSVQLWVQHRIFRLFPVWVGGTWWCGKVFFCGGGCRVLLCVLWCQHATVNAIQGTQMLLLYVEWSQTREAHKFKNIILCKGGCKTMLVWFLYPPVTGLMKSMPPLGDKCWALRSWSQMSVLESLAMLFWESRLTVFI